MNKLHDTLTNMHEPLTASERDTMKAQLGEYMAHMPIRSGQRASQKQNFFSLHYRVTTVFVALALVLTGGAGLTYASTDALPGDTLYFVKEARESVQAAFIQDDVARAEFAIERAHRRLQEIEQLAARGTLDEKREAVVVARAQTSRERAHDRLVQLQDRHPDETQALSFALEAGFDVRLNALTQPRPETPERINERRARIARTLGAREEHAGIAARARESAPAPMAVTAEMTVSAENDTAALFGTEMAVRTPEPTPLSAADEAHTPVRTAGFTPLVRAIEKQQEQLQKLLVTATEKERKRIEAVLEAAAQFNAQAVHGDAEAARKLLRVLHATRVEIETGTTITPPLPPAPLPTRIETQTQEPTEETIQSASPTRAPQPLRFETETHIR